MLLPTTFGVCVMVLAVSLSGGMASWMETRGPPPLLGTEDSLGPSVAAALQGLRKTEHFQWYIIPMLLFLIHLYAVEVQNRRWSAVLAGLALFGMDWFNEVWNALVLHFTRYSAVWVTPPTGSACTILVGWNIEIIFMFLTMGLAAPRLLPVDKKRCLMGVNWRWILAILFAGSSVVVEMGLNWIGVLVWNYEWWSIGQPWSVLVLGYLHFFVVCFLVYDMESRVAQVAVVSLIYTVNVSAVILFGWRLKWI